MAEETWARLGDRIKFVHVKDSMKASAEGFDFALTGEGTVPVFLYRRFSRSNGFDGYRELRMGEGLASRRSPSPKSRCRTSPATWPAGV